MAGQFGYAGRILRVDLSSKSITVSPTSDYSDRFLGGRGVAAKIYWDEVSPQAGAFDPENELLFVTGPLAGFPGLAGSRWQVCGKSPSTAPALPEFFSYANLGGSWGAQLKFAGYDGIVVQGKADEPVYILIRDGKAEIREAPHLWGKGALEAREILKAELGRATRIATIGPAGENMVMMATVIADDDASGSSGLGAVMGSKNLKAIAVRGTGKVTAWNPEKLGELRKYIRTLKKDAAGGYHSNQRPLIVGNPKIKKAACYGCISGCTRASYRAEDGSEGKFMCMSAFVYLSWAQNYYAGKVGDIPFHATRLCNQYGIDCGNIDTLMRWLNNCHLAGILTDENTGIPISRIGSIEFIEALLRKIALREGFGDALAQGVFRAAGLVGDGAEAQIPDDVDKTGLYHNYGPKVYITTGLFLAMEPRQPIYQLHAVSRLITRWLEWCHHADGAYLSSNTFRAIAQRFFGSEVAADFSTYEGKALAAKMIQDQEYAKECLILCDNSWPIMHARHSDRHVGDPTIESKVLHAVTGREVDEEGFYQIGERVFNLQRAILVREGHQGRQSDNLPEADYTVPIMFLRGNYQCLVPGKAGEIMSRKGEVVDREKFERLKDEYYQLRGWDVATGLQTKAKLKELQLQDIAEDLSHRKLIL